MIIYYCSNCAHTIENNKQRNKEWKESTEAKCCGRKMVRRVL